MTLFDEECLVERAAYELEGMKIAAANGRELQPLPQACFEVIKTLPGNNNCIDCGASKPDWATVSYGALICMHCCANHRSLGVQVSWSWTLRGCVKLTRDGALTEIILPLTVLQSAFADNGPLVASASAEDVGGWQPTIERLLFSACPFHRG